MSTDDRSEIYRGQCLCGGGEIVITLCTPDHPWARRSQKSFEPEIACDSCRSKYELLEQYNTYSLVERQEIAKREKLQKEYQKRNDDLLNLSETLKVLDDFEVFLEAQPSHAARYKILREHKFIYESLGTFRKHWTDASEWIKDHVRVSNLSTVLRILGKVEPKIFDEITKVGELYEACNAPLPVVGKPLLDISPYD